MILVVYTACHALTNHTISPTKNDHTPLRTLDQENRLSYTLVVHKFGVLSSLSCIFAQ